MLEEFKKKFKAKDELYLQVKVFPGAGESECKEVLSDNTIKINLAAPAERGKANQELIKFLAREFAVVKNNIKIISGATERLKLIKIKK